MSNKQHVRVVKVPLTRDQIPLDRTPAFPSMPSLYLELFENTNKIKQHLVNKDYVPLPSSPDEGPTRRPKDYKKETPESDNGSFQDRLDNLLKDKPDTEERNDRESDRDEDRGRDKDHGRDEDHDDRSRERDHDDRSRERDHDDRSRDHDDRSRGRSEDSSDDDLYSRLNLLLKKDRDSDSDGSVTERSPQHHRSGDKYSRHRDRRGHSVDRQIAPSLADLRDKGGYVPRHDIPALDRNTMNPEEEEDSKRELMFSFDLMKKKYKSAVIPEFSVHSDYRTMKKSYEGTLRMLSLDESVNQYKTYLGLGFMACEYVFGSLLGFDMEGFTQQQLLSMSSYECLLIELGEKSYVPAGSKWPVELRLLFLIIVNAAFFVLSRMFMKKTGANLLGMMNSMNTNPTEEVPHGRKRTMRGPRTTLEEVPDLDINSTE